MRLGVKPGQIGLSAEQLVSLWREAEDAGFESVWTFDHLTGRLCYEAVALLAAMAVVTRRVRIGCLVLAHGTRTIETVAAQLATIDALSGGRLEVGIGVGSLFAKQDFDALHLPFPSWNARLQSYEAAVERFLALTSPDSPLAARPQQSPIPLILGGSSATVRQLAIRRQLGWNLSTDAVEEFQRLKVGQPDPQVQLFLRTIRSVPEVVAQYHAAGATRLVFVLEPPIAAGAIRKLARQAGL